MTKLRTKKEIVEAIKEKETVSGMESIQVIVLGSDELVKDIGECSGWLTDSGSPRAVLSRFIESIPSGGWIEVNVIHSEYFERFGKEEPKKTDSEGGFKALTDKDGETWGVATIPVNW